VVDCGRCGGHCVVLHGTPACAHSGGGACDTSNTACQIAACDCDGPGECYWDLDHSYATGCEYRCDLTNGGLEVCGDGVANDCDGVIDMGGASPPADATGPCGAPPPAPPGATVPCHAGAKACVGGTVACVGALGPASAIDHCGEDSNCDGSLDAQPDLATDPNH